MSSQPLDTLPEGNEARPARATPSLLPTLVSRMSTRQNNSTQYQNGQPLSPTSSRVPDMVAYHGGEKILNVHSHHTPSSYVAEASAANNLTPAADAMGARPPNPDIHNARRPTDDSETTIAEASGHGQGAPVEKAGPPAAKLNKFAYGFWSPEMKPIRKITFKILGSTTVLCVLLMWICLPLYWGSLWKANRYTNKLTVRVMNQDASTIGNAVSSALLAQTNLRYFTTSPSELPSVATIESDIVNEGAWATVVINAGATSALAAARSQGDATYSGASVISVYYAQARNTNAEGSYLIPYLEAALGMITAQLSAESASQYLKANAGNATAIAALVRAPTTISQSVYYTLVDLRPFSQPVATAITLVGLIYLLIFAFIITMTNNAVREIIAPFLNTKSYLMFRLAVPLSIYLILSFFFAMSQLRRPLPLCRWLLPLGLILFMGMASVGLATEFAITFLGPKFMAFFLVPLIIANVSVASFPHELQPWIFKYGAAMPFYNLSRAVSCIIFDTKNQLGRNCGILLAWIVLSMITITFVTWLVRRKSVNAHRKAMGEAELDDVTPDGRIL